MQDKLNNFKLIFLQKFLFYIIFFVTGFIPLSNISAQTNYKMYAKNGELVNNNTFEFEISIKSEGEQFELTSYQCSFLFSLSDNNFSGVSFEYVAGSSSLSNEPAHFLINTNDDGSHTLAFASNAGNDVITTNEVTVGKFRISRNASLAGVAIGLQWDFEGNINTILTGELFADITNPSGHESEFGVSVSNGNGSGEIGKLAIVNVEASSTVDTNTRVMGVIDGKGYYDGGADSTRWATRPMPQYLIFDLGTKRIVKKTRFSFFNFQKGRIYQYTVALSNDKENWEEVLVNVSSKEEEWSEEEIEPQEARYVKLIFLSSTKNPYEWANLWEAEIWGTELDGSVASSEEEPLVNEYELYQNYPNPFNPNTKIRYRLKEDEQVKLEIYNILGQRVMVVVDEYQTEGMHEVEVNGRELFSGTYIYRLQVGDKFTKAKRMTLLK